MERAARRVPGVSGRLARELENMVRSLEPQLKPYREDFPTFRQLPPEGVARDEVLSLLRKLGEREQDRWREGYVSGAVYHGDPEYIEFLNQVYALYSQANPLHADLWPSISKFEAEIVAMTARMLGAGKGEKSDRVCGTVTSGGTESILLAMKTYRDWARAERGVKKPELILPETAHAAFDKACRYFNIRPRWIPVDEGFRAQVEAARQALSRHTIALVGSAPAFPHGTIDPIEELSELAYQAGVGFHTDACLGGFLLPWAEKLGYRVPTFDFRLRGVTSISADTHKFGYAAKGTSVVLYRTPELRRYQYFTATDWPGGLYLSPTFAGSRPGALSAVAWAAMVSIGEQGYKQAAERILKTAARIRAGVEEIPGLRVLGDPLFVIAFTSDEVDIYQVLEQMAVRGWNLNGLQKPPAVHLCVTLRHTQPGVAERFLGDLRAALEQVKAHPEEKGTLAPIYGMAASLPFRGLIDEVLRKYMDLLYEV
jgi:glutamate/tyrosine decarboxylase-like PLP-dependent enzyme